MNRGVKLSFLIGSVITLTCGCSLVTADETPSAVRLTCPDKLSGRLNESTTIQCRLKNDGPEDIYILTDPLSLEGPQNGKPYLYVPIGWERFENVLQYNSALIGLDVPTLFHPTVHVDFEQLRRLLPLNGGDTIEVNVTWDLAATAFRGATMIARLKLIYLAQSRVVALLKSGLPTDCRNKFVGAFANLKRAKRLTLETQRTSKGTRWFYDNCRDVISENFVHLYSNALVINIDRGKK